MNIFIQNHSIKLDMCYCNVNNDKTNHYHSPFADVTVIIGEQCNARCKFCCGPTKKMVKFDLNKFIAFFNELTEKVNVRKVTFTGGEPTLAQYFTDVMKCIKYIKELSKNTWTIINTNGSNLLLLDNNDNIDQISLSIHHYDLLKNSQIFYGDTITGLSEVMLNNFTDKSKLNFACVCQQDGINSGIEAEKYFEFAIKNNVYDVSLLSMMPVNEYSKNNLVDPNTFIFSDKTLLYKSCEYPVKNVCMCKNFCYVGSTNIPLYFYIRKNLNYKFLHGNYIVYSNNEIKSNY